MRSKGKITTWHDDKGYGFITPLAGGKQVFIHISAFSNRNRRPVTNAVVSYSVTTDKRGRPCAANATLAGDKPVKKLAGKRNRLAIVFAVLFLLGVAASVFSGHLPMLPLIAYASLSLVTFLAYAFDKAAAKSGNWRTSEGTLLALGLAGGWPGGLIAQETLRHKSKKASFRGQFWVTVLLNCLALAWLHTESGQQALQNVGANRTPLPSLLSNQANPS